MTEGKKMIEERCLMQKEPVLLKVLVLYRLTIEGVWILDFFGMNNGRIK